MAKTGLSSAFATRPPGSRDRLGQWWRQLLPRKLPKPSGSFLNSPLPQKNTELSDFMPPRLARYDPLKYLTIASGFDPYRDGSWHLARREFDLRRSVDRSHILCKRRGTFRAHLEGKWLSALIFVIDKSAAASRRQPAEELCPLGTAVGDARTIVKSPFSSRVPTMGDETRQRAVCEGRHGPSAARPSHGPEQSSKLGSRARLDGARTRPRPTTWSLR